MKKLILALPLALAGFACERDESVFEERERAAETYAPPAPTTTTPGTSEVGIDGAVMDDDGALPGIDERGAMNGEAELPEPAQPTSPPSY